MSSADIKQQLHQYIDFADDRMAEALLAIFQMYFQNPKDPIVAYTTKGAPLTKAQMIKEVMDAVEDVNKGNYKTSEQEK